MCSVMVWELISQNQAQGTPIAIKPNFNYMASLRLRVSDSERVIERTLHRSDRAPES
jgi:hypothetical protein